MRVNILNESLEVVDSFDISFIDEIQVEAKKRISSGSVKVGFFLRAGDTFWRVVETGGTLAIEIDEELAKRVTRFRTREEAQKAGMSNQRKHRMEDLNGFTHQNFSPHAWLLSGASMPSSRTLSGALSASTWI